MALRSNMKRLIRFFKNFYLGVIKKNRRFIRISPNITGRILFFDKKLLKFFTIYSRGFTDSVTADQVYTFHDYNLKWLRRFDDIRSTYNNIISSAKKCLIIDCGANIGLSTRYFAVEFPDATIIAIEPDLNNIEIAKTNCKSFRNIEFIHSAVGSIDGFVSISNANAEPNSFRTVKSYSNNDIPMVAINKLLDKYSDHQLFLTKIDIEGFEDELFSQNTDWVEKSYVLIVELHDWMLPTEANSRNFLKTVANLDRDFVFRAENVFSISNEDIK